MKIVLPRIGKLMWWH